MIVGHFTTALIAHKKDTKPPLLFFLIVSQFQDLLWLIFHYLGLEVTTPTNVLEASFKTISVDMLYSHDLIPQILWTALAFCVGKFMYKNTKTGVIAAALIIGHGLLDSISGFNHHIFGMDSHSIGLGFYESNIYLAIAIEIVFTIGTLWYVFKDHGLESLKKNAKKFFALFGVFSYGIIFMLLTAEQSFSELFGIPVIDFGFNTAIPTLISTYLIMIWLINKFGRIQR